MAQTTIDDAINGLKDDDVNIKMDSLEYLMNVNNVCFFSSKSNSYSTILRFSSIVKLKQQLMIILKLDLKQQEY